MRLPVCSLLLMMVWVPSRSLAQQNPAPTGQGPGANPAPTAQGSAADPHQMMQELDLPEVARAFSPPQLPQAEMDPSIPPGEIQVRVVGTAPGAVTHEFQGMRVELGVLVQGGARNSRTADVSPSGQATFTGLPRGDAQAYRVRLRHQGALFATTPFRLPPSAGMRVTLRVLPVSSDLSTLLLVDGETQIQVSENRLNIQQRLQLANVGGSALVIPENGIALVLPSAATAFQTESVMTDQRLSQSGRRVVLNGSFLPGAVQLSFRYDLPISGGTQSIAFGNPFHTITYRVVSQHGDGLSLSVEGFPEPIVAAQEGQRYFVTESVRSRDNPLRQVSIRLTGLPNQWPYRIGTTLGALALFLVVAVWLKRGAKKTTPNASSTTAIDDLKNEYQNLLTDDTLTPEEKKEAQGEITRELALRLLRNGSGVSLDASKAAK